VHLSFLLLIKKETFMIDKNLVISQLERYILLIEIGRSKNVESISNGKIELENHGLFVH
jgi:hypothetical protein